MAVLFGGSLAIELGETVRKQREDFDSIDIETHLKKHQLKNKSAEIIAQQRAKQKQQQSQNSDQSDNEDLNSFINGDESSSCSDDDDHSSAPSDINSKDQTNDDVQYLDVREQTIFRYSDRLRFSKYDKKMNGKKSSFAYIQNNNVRTSYKNKTGELQKIVDEETYFKKDPFMDQKLLRQNFKIDRSKRDFSMIKDQTRIQRLARNNMSFIKEVLTAKKIEMKKNLLFDKSRFNRRLRFALGAPNRRRQRNYKEFGKAMKNRQNDFFDKKDLYRERGLRVENQLNDKVLFSKYGRSKVWNAGRSKAKSNRKTVGSYEFAKSINTEW